jgi:hypothetical protein
MVIENVLEVSMDRLNIERKKEEMPSLNEDGGGRSTIMDYKQPYQRVPTDRDGGGFLSGFTPVYMFSSFCDMKS